MAQFADWIRMNHNVFTDLSGRDDEFDFVKVRGERGGREALAELERRYEEWDSD